jgi:DNA-binding transcriptional MerR regulator
MRDLKFLKPNKFKDHMTIAELARFVRRDPSRIRQLERAGRIPKAVRVTRGENEVRLWSPAQCDEIKEIIDALRPGRPSST